MALFDDPSTEQEAKIPTQLEKRQRQLLDRIKKRQKPVVRFIDKADDWHGKTPMGLKRLKELVRNQGDILAVVLAGHPELKHDLRRPSIS